MSLWLVCAGYPLRQADRAQDYDNGMHQAVVPGQLSDARVLQLVPAQQTRAGSCAVHGASKVALTLHALGGLAWAC